MKPLTNPTRTQDESGWSSRISIGPIEVDAASREDVIEQLLHVAFHESATRAVATVNAQFYVLAEGDFVFRDCVRRSEFVCADGVSIGMAAAILARRRVERLAGVDLVEEICRRGASRGIGIFLFGGRPGSASCLAAMLCKRYPGVTITGHLCPPFGFENLPSLCLPRSTRSLQRAHTLSSWRSAPPNKRCLSTSIFAG